MDFTKFRKLQDIIVSLGADPVDIELHKALTDKGIVLDDPERIVVGETGLFYIDPRGTVTRVLLYIVDKNIEWHKGDEGNNIRKILSQKDFGNPELLKTCHKYHFLNCITQEKAQTEGWRRDCKLVCVSAYYSPRR